jgi:HSP20 family protein
LKYNYHRYYLLKFSFKISERPKYQKENMAGYYLYPAPVFYSSTHVADTYPEHHLPLHNARHKLTHAMHDYFVGDETNVQTPHVDLRETAGRYYIDVELPGLTSAADLKIQWSNPNVVVIRGTINRAPTLEEVSAADVAVSTKSKSQPANGDNVSTQTDEPVHVLRAERHIGSFRRAFDFASDVEHDTLKATLLHGLLSIVVDKKPHQDMKHKKIEVETAFDNSVSKEPKST